MLPDPAKQFPKLKNDGYQRTSPSTDRYNCIAWAAGVDTEWWEPDPFGLFRWPDGVIREASLRAYIAAFKKLGFKPCRSRDLEPDVEKIALYLRDGVPLHAAKQLPDGKWSSKLGTNIDITHTLDGLNGGDYGCHSVYMKRPRVPKSS